MSLKAPFSPGASPRQGALLGSFGLTDSKRIENSFDPNLSMDCYREEDCLSLCSTTSSKAFIDDQLAAVREAQELVFPSRSITTDRDRVIEMNHCPSALLKRTNKSPALNHHLRQGYSVNERLSNTLLSTSSSGDPRVHAESTPWEAAQSSQNNTPMAGSSLYFRSQNHGHSLTMPLGATNTIGHHSPPPSMTFATDMMLEWGNLTSLKQTCVTVFLELITLVQDEIQHTAKVINLKHYVRKHSTKNEAGYSDQELNVEIDLIHAIRSRLEIHLMKCQEALQNVLEFTSAWDDKKIHYLQMNTAMAHETKATNTHDYFSMILEYLSDFMERYKTFCFSFDRMCDSYESIPKNLNERKGFTRQFNEDLDHFIRWLHDILASYLPGPTFYNLLKYHLHYQLDEEYILTTAETIKTALDVAEATSVENSLLTAFTSLDNSVIVRARFHLRMRVMTMWDERRRAVQNLPISSTLLRSLHGFLHALDRRDKHILDYFDSDRFTSESDEAQDGSNTRWHRNKLLRLCGDWRFSRLYFLSEFNIVARNLCDALYAHAKTSFKFAIHSGNGSPWYLPHNTIYAPSVKNPYAGKFGPSPISPFRIHVQDGTHTTSSLVNHAQFGSQNLMTPTGGSVPSRWTSNPSQHGGSSDHARSQYTNGSTIPDFPSPPTTRDRRHSRSGPSGASTDRSYNISFPVRVSGRSANAFNMSPHESRLYESEDHSPTNNRLSVRFNESGDPNASPTRTYHSFETVSSPISVLRQSDNVGSPLPEDIWGLLPSPRRQSQWTFPGSSRRNVLQSHSTSNDKLNHVWNKREGKSEGVYGRKTNEAPRPVSMTKRTQSKGSVKRPETQRRQNSHGHFGDSDSRHHTRPSDDEAYHSLVCDFLGGSRDEDSHFQSDSQSYHRPGRPSRGSSRGSRHEPTSRRAQSEEAFSTDLVHAPGFLTHSIDPIASTPQNVAMMDDGFDIMTPSPLQHGHVTGGSQQGHFGSGRGGGGFPSIYHNVGKQHSSVLLSERGRLGTGGSSSKMTKSPRESHSRHEEGNDGDMVIRHSCIEGHLDEPLPTKPRLRRSSDPRFLNPYYKGGPPSI